MALTSEYYDYGMVLLAIAAASYIQALVGFSFAVILMGAIATLNLMPVADAAVITTLLAMGNTGTALIRGHSNVRWRETGAVLLVSLPAIVLGLYLLDQFGETHLGRIRMALAVVMFLSGAMILKPPRQDAVISRLPSFALSGLISGVVGGLFATGGPFIVYQFYRQPLSLQIIRDSLFAVFFLGSLARTILVVLDTGIETRLLILSAIGFPVVVVFTRFGLRFAPNLPETTLRRAVFGLMVLTALALMLG